MKQYSRPGLITVRRALILAGVLATTSGWAQSASAASYSSAGSVNGVTYTVLDLTRNTNGTLTETIRLQAKDGELVKPDAIGYTPYYANAEYPGLDFKLIDFVHKLHYEKIQDSAGNCMCTKLTDQQIVELGAGKPQIIRIKFPAPPADVTSLTVELPHAEPIDEVPLTQTAPPNAAASYSGTGSVGEVTYTVLGLTRNTNGTLTESVRLQAREGELVKPEAIGYSPYYADAEYPGLDFKLIDYVHHRRYDKMVDGAGNCSCTKLTDQQIADLAAGKPQVVNIRFQSPPSDVTSLTVELPHAEPIENVPVTQAPLPSADARLSTPSSLGSVTYTVLGLTRNGNGTLTESIQVQAAAGTPVKPVAIGYSVFYADAETPGFDYRLMDYVHKIHYEMIKDTAGNCMCSKLTDRQIADLGAGKPQVINIKFEAPPADVTQLTVELPHAEPIDNAPITG